MGTKENNYMTGTINACRIILAVKFEHASYNESMYICTVDQLAKVLEDKSNEKGIEFIKELNPSKLTFNKVSKTQIMSWANMDTGASEFLKNHPYFKM